MRWRAQSPVPNVIWFGQGGTAKSGVRQEEIVATKIQITFDCADPDRLARFWAEALHYRLQDPPAGFDSWASYYRSIGVPEEELDEGFDSVVDAEGIGPRIWFQRVPEGKVVKNRVHLDLDVTGGRSVPMETRRERVDAEADRLVGVGATSLRITAEPGSITTAWSCRIPEGNEFCLH